MAKLTKQQQLFVKEYLVSFNATKAAQAAKYSKKTAYSQGQRLLKHVEIQAALQKEVGKRFKALDISTDRILNECARIAFADPRDIAEWDADGVILKSSGDLTDDQAAAVAAVSHTISQVGSNVQFKMLDKIKALELLGKYHKLWVERQEVTGKDGGPVEIEKPLSDDEKAELEKLRKKLKKGK